MKAASRLPERICEDARTNLRGREVLTRKTLSSLWKRDQTTCSKSFEVPNDSDALIVLGLGCAQRPVAAIHKANDLPWTRSSLAS